MNYELTFDPRALKEWQKLGVTVREQFKKKLEDALKRPRNPSAKLRIYGLYKIKLRTQGYAWFIRLTIKSCSCWN